ncbi:energy transducer TonB [Pedobacter sp. ISL-64]|uniref:energy transducer TonB n=1 Tax=Pedobacter sp. ISL-64 TaxID=2819164 RepID=UPI001BE8A1F9|nr:energy transducer TonB [Pedobacter sp. ISL-64]MBT2562486.1 energy transducer TonB [Pedobacter sp. ISL-64]
MPKILAVILFLISCQQLYSQERSDTIKIDLIKTQENYVYWPNEVDTSAHFPNEETAWNRYLLTNSRYAELPKKDRAIGKVYLSFVIEKDGRITDVVVKRGLNFKCDEEALRLLRTSEMWIPATLKSRKVRSKGNVSINFGLN